MKYSMRACVVAVATCLTIAGNSFASAASSQPDINALAQRNEISSDKLLVKFRATTTPTTITQTLQSYALDSVRPFYQPRKYLNLSLPNIDALQQWRVLDFSQGVNLGETFQSLRNNPLVESVVPDTVMRINVTPNDLDSRLWNLNNTGQDNGTADADVDAVEAWDIATDASNIVVAVIDTGIDYTHPDLADNIWTNPGEIPGNGIDDDNNGYIDDIHGYDFANDDADPMDDHYHGTHVSGTIAATGNNSEGVVGIAWKAKLMAVKFLNQSGSGLSSDAIDAVLYAADNGAIISNNSWGQFNSTHYLEVYNAPLKEAMRVASTAGHLFVVAAGNEGTYTDEGYSAHPSGITLSNILSVAATDRNDALTSFSNYGEVEVDIAAPGEDIYSTMPNNQYEFLDGTSMAAPHVTGAAALLYSIKPDLSPEEAKAILMNTVDPLANLQGIVGAGGRLNVHNALSALDGGPSCNSFTGTAQNHVNAGRAHACGYFNLYACANGSNTNLGSLYSSALIELVESGPNHYTVGQCNSSGQDMPPVISMQGEAETRLLVGSTYTLPGATASDREDGSLIVTTSGSVNTSVAGDYVISYNATDSAGNPAVTERRLVQVLAEDSPPEVVLFGPQCRLPLFCQIFKMEQNTAYQEPGYIGIDEIDGDITSQVTVTGDVLSDTSTIGRSRVYYDVIDSSGQHFPAADMIFREVFVLDAEVPYIVMDPEKEEMSFPRGTCCVSSHTYHGVIDLKDAWETAETEGEVNADIEGTYVLRHYHTDSDGNYVERFQTVHIVEDITPPHITLNGEAIVTTQVGTFVPDPWASATDDLDNNPYVERIGDVDFDTVGTYTLEYYAEDSSGNRSTSVYRTVNVVSPCTEFNDTNANHVNAGRAYSCGLWGSNACATGSGDSLGSRWAYAPTVIHELNPGSGVYYVGSCP